MKNSLLKVISVVLIFLTGLGMGVGGFWLVLQNNVDLRYHLLEQTNGNQPQALISEFVQAIVEGDHMTALELWETGDPDPQSPLAERREGVTSELESAGVSLEYSILDIEWWTTCCTPSVTCDSREAGGARILVQFMDRFGEPNIYFFDIFTRQPYWGGAAGYPPRDWVIRDVYPVDQEPFFWPLIYVSQTQPVQPSEP